MRIVSYVCSVLGAVISVSAALWLIFGMKPTNPRYQVVRGGGYTQSVPVGITTLMIDQGKAAGVATIGGVLQLIGVVLNIWV
jgi:hypothetical protein